MPFCRLTFFLIIIVIPAACGFHLRGSPALQGEGGTLPPEMAVTFIEAPSQTSHLVRQLKRALRSADILLVEEIIPAAAVLRLREDLERRVLSVDSQGRAVEYELYYTVNFAVSRNDIEWEIPSQSITLTRDYFFDRLDALGADRQEALLRQDMQRELARLILDRIRATKLSEEDATSPPPPPTTIKKPDAETQRHEVNE